MTPNELLILRVCCIAIFIFSSIIKLIAWFTAKKDTTIVKNYFLYFFKWYNVYSLYDNDYIELRDFMKTNNNTNRFIWIATMLFVITYFL